MNKRQRQLIDILSEEVKPAKYYADILNVSLRTMYNDLEKIKPFLKSEGLILEKVSGVGIYVTKIGSNQKSNVENTSYVFSPIERQVEIFKRLLLTGDSVSISDLSFDYYISESTIRSDISKIESIFIDDNTCELNKEPSNIKLLCNDITRLETHIKFSQYLYINHAKSFQRRSFFEHLSSIYSEEIVNACLEVIELVEKTNVFFLGDHYRTNLLIVLVAIVYSNKRYSHLKEATTLVNFEDDFEIRSDDHVFLAKTLLDALSVSMKIKFSENELKYLVRYLKGVRVSTISPQKSRSNVNVVIGDKILDNLANKLGIDVTTSDSIREQLIIHINSMMYRLENDINIKNILTEEIQSKYSVLFNSLWIVLEQEIEKYLPSKIVSADEVAFIVIYIQTLLSKQKQNKRILIICPTGLSTSQYIVNRLKEILPPFDVFEVSSINDINERVSENFDLIVSTVDLAIENENIIVVSPLLNNRDIIRISKFYNDNFIVNKADAKERFPILTKLIKSKNILFESLYDEKFNKELAITKMIDTLVDNQFVRKGYLKSVFDREAQGSTVITEMISLPHGSPTEVRKSTVGIMIYKEALKWDDHSIKLSFFPCIAKDDTNFVRELFQEIYYLSNNERLINQIVEAKNSKEIIKIIKGVENDK